MEIHIHKSKGIYRGDLIRVVKVRGFFAFDSASLWEQPDGTFVTVLDDWQSFRLTDEGADGLDADMLTVYEKERD